MARPLAGFRSYVKQVSGSVPESVTGPAGSALERWRGLPALRRRLISYAVAIVLMALIPPLMAEEFYLFYLLGLTGDFGTNILVVTGYFILLTLGLSVVVGLAGLLDLGYAAFFMLGAYTTALMTQSGSPGQFHFVEWHPWAALPFAILVCCLAGLILGAPTLRLRGDYLAIVTLGFHEMVRLTMNNLAITNGSRGIAAVPNPDFTLFGVDVEFGLDSEMYWWFLLIPGIMIAVVMIKNLENSRIGRYWTAIREDEVAAAAMGVPVVKMKLWAFVIGASTSGAAGWIYATFITYVAPNSFPLLLSIMVLSAVVVGGLGSIAGAVLGAILIVTLPEIIRERAGDDILGFDPETGRIAIFGFLLILVMIYRPGGLLAPKRRRTELAEASAADAVITAEEVRGEEEPTAPEATTPREARAGAGRSGE